MALQPQVVSLPFGGGLDTKTDSKQVSAGELLVLENAIWTTIKKFRKRNGYTKDAQAITVPVAPSSFSNLGGGAIANGSLVAAFLNEKVMSDGQNFYSWSPASSTWAYRGRAEICSITSQQVLGNTSQNIAPDSAQNSTLGVTVFAWESWTADPSKGGTLNGVQVTIKDTATGAAIANALQLASTTSCPRCVSVGGNLYVLYYDSGDSKIHALPITATGVGSASVLISAPATSPVVYDCAVFNSLLYVAYNAAAAITVASFSSALAAVSSRSAAGESASNGLAIFPDVSNNAWVAYNNGTAVKAFIFNSALSSTALAVTSVDASPAAGGKNVAAVHDGTRGVIFYDSPGVPILGVQLGAAAGSPVTTSANFTQPAVGSTVTVSLSGGIADAGQVIYIAGGGYYFVNSILSTSMTVTNLGYTGNAAPAATVFSGAALYSTGGYQNAIVTYNTLTLAGAAGTPSTFSRSLALASRAFLQNGFAHVVLTRDSALQAMYFLCALFNVSSSLPAAHVVAKISSLQGGGGIPYRNILSSVNSPSANNYQFSLMNRTLQIDTLASGAFDSQLIFLNGIANFTVNCAPTQVPSRLEGQNLQIGGGLLRMYDGANIVEHGFNFYPESLTYTLGGAGSSFIGPGTYGYCAVYSWIDNQGQVHRSAPSPVTSVVQLASPNGKTVTLAIPTLRVTEKQGVTIEVYRTIANQNLYFRIDTLLSGYPYKNSTTADTVSVTDTLVDSQIIGSTQLYTTGEVANGGSLPTIAMTTFKERVITILAESPYSWNFSKQVIPGSPVEFSLAFQKNVDQADGPLTAAGVLDDKLILFKANAIYFVVGTGPGASGAGDDFTDAFKIPSDVGCVDPASVLEIPDGLMFRSNNGIYLLSRGLQVSYIGAAVETYNANHVLASAKVPGTTQARFCLDNGKAAVYDYLVKKWGTHTNIAAVSACIWNGIFVYLQSGGAVMAEAAGVFTDNGAFIGIKASTSWVQFAGVQGFQRIWEMLILGDYIGPHNLLVTVYKDFNAGAAIQNETITGQLVDGVYQWRVPMAQQKCESMMFVIQDSQSSSFNEGLSLSAITFNVGMKKGPFKMGSAHG